MITYHIIQQMIYTVSVILLIVIINNQPIFQIKQLIIIIIHLKIFVLFNAKITFITKIKMMIKYVLMVLHHVQAKVIINIVCQMNHMNVHPTVQMEK